jgi:hypothetical protein
MVPLVMRLCLAQAAGLSALLISGSAPAQNAEPAPPASPAPAAAPAAQQPAAACFPACRDGFTCSAGQCVSLCNPPCPNGLECVDGRRCEPPLPGGTVRPYEPPPPPVKDFEDRSHALLGFHLGLPGSLGRDGRSQDLDTTLGFNLRADSPVAKYVLLGPLIQFGSWRPDTSPAAGHNYYVDLDLLLRFRAPITTSNLNYQLWVGMPIGLSVDVLGDDSAASSVGLGWNVGVLFGGAVHFSPKFGLFAETGWEQHRVAHTREKAPDLDFKLQQALLNLGIIVRN